MYNMVMDGQNVVISQKQKSSKLQEWKKLFLYATISMFSLSAFLGICFILFGTNAIGGKAIGTTAIMGVFSLFTMNNIIRLENEQKSVRYSAAGALISNVIWLIPSVLMLWGFFEIFQTDCQSSGISRSGYAYEAYEACMQPYYVLQEVILKIINTACVTSAVLTLISNFMSFKNYTPAIRVLKITTMACGVLLGTYEIGAVFFNRTINGEFWRVLAIVGIILVFGLIVTPIMVRISRKQEEASVDNNQRETVDEAVLRAQIEQEVRAEIAAEQAAGQVTELDDKQTAERSDEQMTDEVNEQT